MRDGRTDFHMEVYQRSDPNPGNFNVDVDKKVMSTTDDVTCATSVDVMKS